MAVTDPTLVEYRDLVTPHVFDRIVRRVMKDEGVSAEIAERSVESALGFLRLCARHPGHAFVPCHLVDIGWHAFLLHTREYHEFCSQEAGGFIHHRPADEGEPAQTTIATVEFMRSRSIPYDEEIWNPNSDEGGSGCNACQGCGMCNVV